MGSQPYWREIGALTLVRLKLFLREPEAVFWVIVFPVILTIVLGFAFRTTEPGPSRVAILAPHGQLAAADQEALERLERRLNAHPKRVVVERVPDEDTARRKLRKGAIDALVIWGKPPRVRSDPNRAEGELAQLRIAAMLGDQRHGAVVAAERRSERGSRYIDFLFFGILGMNLMGTGIFGVGFGIADMRQKKLLRRLLVTPMRRSSLMLSFMLSRLVFLAGEVVVLMAFGAWVLDVPMGGSFIQFIVLGLLGGFGFASLGLLLASRARTIEGVSGLMNLAMIPMWLASGVFFSYERFPEALHLPIRLLPLTALNDAFRAVMLDGRSLLSLPLESGVLVLWAVIPLLLALKVFRWE